MTKEVHAEPFLKWAGGKRSLLPRIAPLIPDSIKTYHEPFIGAGAVFFSGLHGKRAIINDTNAELINTYNCIRDEVETVVTHLKTFANSKDEYLRIRALDRTDDFQKLEPAFRAARVIYLNKCGFNGLYRVNANGFFNVPYGRNYKADYVNESNLMRVHEFLNLPDTKGGARLETTSVDFRKALKKVKKGDFVYLDPPYDPISKTSAFTSYSALGFTPADQEDLRDEVVRLTHLGARVLISNSNTVLIRKLFSDKSIFHVSKIEVRRSISAIGNRRTPASEVLIDNYKAID